MKSQKAQIFWTSLVAIGLAVMALHSIFNEKPTRTFTETTPTSERFIKDSFEIR